MTPRLRVAILISGRGSNMSALIEAARAPDFPATIALVMSDKVDAAGLAIARGQGVAAEAVDAKSSASREQFEAALDARLRAEGIEIVCLAGFMRILSPAFVQRWERRMLNIHPSLLPALKGLDTHRRALAEGRSEHGCTVHFVSAELDSGPIVAQARVAVLPEDDPDSLAARVLDEEHRLYPQALGAVATALLAKR